MVGFGFFESLDSGLRRNDGCNGWVMNKRAEKWACAGMTTLWCRLRRRIGGLRYANPPYIDNFKEPDSGLCRNDDR
jgi:hypothetical protein